MGCAAASPTAKVTKGTSCSLNPWSTIGGSMRNDLALKGLPPTLPETAPEATLPVEPFAALLASSTPQRTEIPPVVVGRLLALTDGRATALVAFEDQPTEAAVRARTAIDLFPEQIGHEVLLTFERQDRTRPIVMGVLRTSADLATSPATAQHVEVRADGQRLTIKAQDELVLQCGRSTIILSADGRLELHADVIVSQAAEVNRIRGGSVQLN